MENNVLPPTLDEQLLALGYGNASILLDYLCKDEERWVVSELVKADTDHRRLYLQAYASVVQNLRRKLEGKSNRLRKDLP